MTGISSPQKVLVIATRQIGDVLLTTPLLYSLRKAYPDAQIDVLGYDKKCQMLEGNTDINNIIEVVEKPNSRQVWQLITRIFRHYDLAISTLSGDKPHFYALLASKKRIGLIDDLSKKTWWKRLSCKHWVMLDNKNTHTVIQNLKLLAPLAIPVNPEIRLPTPKQPAEIIEHTPFAMLHPFPMWQYKQWTLEGWRLTIDHLLKKGLHVFITGGTSVEEKTFCDNLANHFQHQKIESLAGKTQIAELTPYLQKANCYIGPDTSVTHMAAASGCPTIALFGPSNPVKWGPWPANHIELVNPFDNKVHPWQIKKNVLLLQGVDMTCVPCHEEGCDKHKKSDSQCLQNLKPEIVIKAIDALIGEGIQ
jgi:heptosyltransferase-3